MQEIRMPQKVDTFDRLIRDPKVRAHRWRLNVPESVGEGRRRRLFFLSEGEAKEAREALLRQRQAAGGAVDLVGRLAARGISVAQALQFALERMPKTEVRTVDEAVPLFLASRRRANCRQRYLDNLASQLGIFRKKFGRKLVDAIVTGELDLFVERFNTPKTRVNYVITLQAFFNFNVGQGWCSESPAAKLIRPTLDEVPTKILTPAEVEEKLVLLRDVRFDIVRPAALLQLYGGVRRSEAPHIVWGDIRDSFLRLEKTKIRKKRAVELCQNLLAYLAQVTGPLTARVLAPPNIEYRPDDTRPIEDWYSAQLADLGLEKNILRHTAITYRDALTGDHADTASWAGNSVGIVEEHYRGAATRRDAEKFYALSLV